MLTRFVVAIVGCTLATPTFARELRATFIGNEAFHITDGRVAVLTDFPYESGAFGYMTWAQDAVPRGGTSLCLFSHLHADHFALKRVPDFCSAVMGPRDVSLIVGLTTTVLSAATEWQGITVRAIPTPHGSIEHYSLLLEWGGSRLFLTGDTTDPSSLLAAHGLDVAFVSPWVLEAVQAKGLRIDAKQVVVYHHRAGESVMKYQDPIVPKQGQVLVIGSK